MNKKKEPIHTPFGKFGKWLLLFFVLCVAALYSLSGTRQPARRHTVAQRLTPIPAQEDGIALEHVFHKGELHCISRYHIRGSLPLFIHRTYPGTEPVDEEYLILRRLHPQDHAQDLYELLKENEEYIGSGDPVPAKYLGKEAPSTRRFLEREAFLQSGYTVGIFFQKGGEEKLVGRLHIKDEALPGADPTESVVMISYLTGDPEVTKAHGVMTPCLQAFTDHLFFSNQIDRYVLIINQTNKASIRVAKKLGLRRQKASDFYKGKHKKEWRYRHFSPKEGYIYMMDKKDWCKSWEKRTAEATR